MEENDTQEQVQVGEVDTTTNNSEIGTPESELLIPENWESGVKDFINGITDKAGKKAVFDKISNLEKGYNKKYQDLASLRKQYESDERFIKAYRDFEGTIDKKDLIEAQFGSMQNYYNRLYKMDVLASSNPRQFIINYLNNNGITAEQLTQLMNEPEVKQDIYNRSREAEKEQWMREMEQRQRQKAFADDVIRFADAKDENGNLLHPHISELANTMDYLVANGDSLETAYNKALRLNDNLYKQTLEAETAKRVEAMAQANEVAKAKNAIGVKTKTPYNAPKEKRDYRDVLDEMLGSDD